MKRGADNQITRDGVSDEETEEVSTTFKRADESALATRKIRGLPKRALAGTGAAVVNGTSTTEVSTTPKFSGFAGFGTSSANSAFTFAAPSTKSPSLIPQSSLDSLPQPLGTPSLTAVSPTVSSTATSTAKTLATFLGVTESSSPPSKSAVAGPLPFPLTKSPTATLATSAPVLPATSTVARLETGPSNAAIKYYSELRGLNISVLAAITKAVEDDPFVDVTRILEQYKSKRTHVQSDFDKTKDSGTSKPATTTTTSQPTMPMPPPSFTFGNRAFVASSPKTGDASNGIGFQPKLSTTTTAAPSPFTFLRATASSEASALSDDSAESAKESNTRSPFFRSATTSTSSPFNTPSFGNVSKPDTSSAFKFPTPQSSSSTSPTVTSPFSPSSPFGAPTSGSNPFAKPSTSIPTFGGFPKTSGSGSIGNPVGFGFGVHTSKDSDNSGDAKSTTTSGFSFAKFTPVPFGALVPTAESKKTNGSEEGGEENGGDDANVGVEGDNAAARTGLSGPSPHDVEGEGEEEEETTHSVKLKAHRMKKGDEKGGPGWVEIGVGVLRLKRHKETSARRMLLRNGATGKISINFMFYAGFKVTLAKRSLTFVGHENGVSQTYSVRLPNEDQARLLKEAIEREVVLVKHNDD
ncbi:hypothetical protein AX17_004014 [Amanita inopinata Kibby_2008]|nr:hypothetical protein AX17_004014 [Amanita inopinata Kibby_2008]